ncbi:MAG: carotenoid 1,2-hydratase [Magnetococcales bacterium]|nr:carotenoid 1,2-hydratase [Magnetococcales bacterium]
MRKRWIVMVVVVMAVVLIAAMTRFDNGHRSDPDAVMTSLLGGGDDAGFDRATPPRPFHFPADHGPHPQFKHEWWYMTGTLATTVGERRFGYELTLFRLALTPKPMERTSKWGSTQVQMGHFAVTDIQKQQFHHAQRFSRIAMDLAGAVADPFRVWLGDWSIAATGGTPLAPTMHLAAHHEDITLDLNLTARKPVVLQGENGLSRKSERPGNASYYYSLPRMETTGWLTLQGERFPVTGMSWFDREWSTSALDEHQEGWDWFALHLSDGWDLMLYRMREKNGTTGTLSAGALIDPDGTRIPFAHDAMIIDPLGHWRSPKTEIVYPSGWRLRVATVGIDLSVTPWIQDQELNRTLVRYWEGAVQVRGVHAGLEVQGDGYVELAGYH